MVRDAPGMLEIFGTIDSAAEAALIVTATRTANGSNQTVTGVSIAPLGFDVATTYFESVCTPVIAGSAIVHVTPEGELRVGCDHLISCTASCI